MRLSRRFHPMGDGWHIHPMSRAKLRSTCVRFLRWTRAVAGFHERWRQSAMVAGWPGVVLPQR